MSPLEALEAARASGVEVRLDGKDLIVSAASEPPDDICAMLSRHKAAIVGLLQQRCGAGLPQPARPWGPEDWQAHYDERAAIAEFDGGLCRPEAEERAFNCCVAEWLGRNPVYSSSDRCLLCAEADRPNDSLLPVGLAGAGQAWLHRDCVPAWRSARMGAAVEALMAMNIKKGPSSAGIEITGSTAAGAETAAASPLITGTEVASSASGAGSAHVAILRQTQGDERSTDDWQAFVDQQVRIAEGDGLARPAAEARAFDDAVAEWMLRNPVNSAPGTCPLCGEADRPSDPLEFIGIIGARTWLHIGCSTIWVKDRKAEAVAALAAMGIKGPADGAP